MLGFGDKKRSLEIIDAQLAAWERQLAKRYANLARWEQSGLYVRLMAELGVRMNEVFVAWLREARREIVDAERWAPAAGPVDNFIQSNY